MDNSSCCFKFQVVYAITELFMFIFFFGMFMTGFVIFSALIIQSHMSAS